MRYLIIAAHPDDEALGCGGSMSKWSKNGHEVHVVIMAEGATSRDEKRDRESRQSEISNLAKSSRKAGKIFGVKSLNLLDFPDNRMDSVDLLDVIKTIESFIKNIKPDIVVTHHSSDLNIDHQIIHQAVITACRPQPENSVNRILTFEVPSATEWQSPTYGNSFTPNWFEDISETLDYKIKSLKIYKSEIRDWPHSRSIKAIEHLARWRGASVGCKAAEAFNLIRNVAKQ